MANHSAYIVEAAKVQNRVIEKLQALLNTRTPLTLPARSRYGEFHLTLLQWQAMEGWLDTVESLQSGESGNIGDIGTNENFDISNGQAVEPSDIPNDQTPETLLDFGSLNRDELLTIAESKNLTLIASGANGYVTRADLLKALNELGAN